MPEIRSGVFGDARSPRDYRAEYLGPILVERVVWGEDSYCERYGLTLAAPGHVWFRFWLPHVEQVVERYYAADGELIGTQVAVCMPMDCSADGCKAQDLILALWLDPDGRVVLHNEAAFESAVREHRLTGDETVYAEQHLRQLTAGIAQGRVPPPLVRNWQVDPQRIQEANQTRSYPDS